MHRDATIASVETTRHPLSERCLVLPPQMRSAPTVNDLDAGPPISASAPQPSIKPAQLDHLLQLQSGGQPGDAVQPREVNPATDSDAVASLLAVMRQRSLPRWW